MVNDYQFNDTPAEEAPVGRELDREAAPVSISNLHPLQQPGHIP